MYTIEEFDAQKSKVLKYVLFKKRTKQEIINKFSNTIENQMLKDIIENLQENGYINDENYVQRAINEFIALKNLSINEIKYKLLNKGINSNLIEDYLEENREQINEYEIQSAKNIIIKKQSSMDEETIIKYLLKKGYKTKNVKQAIENINN